MTTAVQSTRPRARSIRQSVILLQLALQILFLVLFAIFGNLILAQTVRGLWTARLDAAATHATHDVESQIVNALGTLKIAGNLDLSQAEEDIADLQGLVDSILAANPSFREIVVTAANGDILLSSAVTDPILSRQSNITDQLWFTASADSDFVSDVEFSPDSQAYLTVSTRRTDGGVVAAVINMTVFNEALQEIHLGESTDSYVVDSDGHVLAHVEYEWVEARSSLVGREEWERILSAPDRVTSDINYTNFEGESVVGSSKGIPGTGWTVITEVSTTLANEARTQMQLFVITLIIGFSVIAGFLNERAFKRLLFDPLKRLQNGAENVAKGDLNTSVPIQRYNELGIVTEEFNAMVVRIREQTEDLKRANAEALRAQRLAQENNRLKSEFLSTMSHELRTPLNAIEGFTSIMLGNMGVDLGPQARKMVERISANSKRLLSLINDFLDLSRIESGRMELVSEPITPAAFTERIQKQMSALADTKRLAFTTSVDPELPPTVYGDEEAISKIAINLVGNAIKFTANGSVAMNVRKDGDQWAIEVSDTGIGIPPHAREFIFDEFRQVDSTSKREFGGTGLGLAIVQKLTRMMGGQVQLESEVGKGSKFTVLLPLNSTPSAN